jgi:hypothetical protein
MPITDNLVAYWKMEEASGSRASEVNSHTLADNNTVTQATGKLGNAAQFTAANSEYLSIADNADVSAGDVDWTLGLWVYLDSTAGSQTILAKGDGGSGEFVFKYRAESSGFFKFEVYGASGFGSPGVVSTEFVVLPTASTWYFILLRHDATANTLTIAVNNGTPISVSHSAGIYNGTGAFTVGGWPTFSEYFTGRIDSLGIWKRVLSSQDQTDLYNGGTGLEYPFAGDTTAPVLTSPVGTETGQTTATVGATTDEANGTLYVVVTTSGTQPSVAQIKAGQDHTGAAAAFADDQAIGSTGAKTFPATGLTAATGYYAHLVHTDAATNDSNRVASALFTTDSGPVYPDPSDVATGVEYGPNGDDYTGTLDPGAGGVTYSAF